MLAERYRGKVIVVTGALGMIGSHLVRALVDAGCRVLACDHVGLEERPAYLAGLSLEGFVKPERLRHGLEARPDQIGAIVHMGAISDTTESNLDLLTSNNVNFTLDLWHLSAANGWPFLYASSAATYGAGEHGFSDSDGPAYLSQLRPLNLYGESKHNADLKMVADWRAGLPSPPTWAGFKFFNVYGPNEEHKGAMRSLVAKLLPVIEAGEPVKLFQSHHPDYGDGLQERDFIYVKDAIRPVLAALERSELSGLFNVGTGQARTFLDLALATYAALDRRPAIEFVEMPAAIRGQYQYHTKADTLKSAQKGLFDVRYSLEDGVRHYVRVLRSEAGGSNGL